MIPPNTPPGVHVYYLVDATKSPYELTERRFEVREAVIQSYNDAMRAFTILPIDEPKQLDDPQTVQSFSRVSRPKHLFFSPEDAWVDKRQQLLHAARSVEAKAALFRLDASLCDQYLACLREDVLAARKLARKLRSLGGADG